VTQYVPCQSYALTNRATNPFHYTSIADVVGILPMPPKAVNRPYAQRRLFAQFLRSLLILQASCRFYWARDRVVHASGVAKRP